MFKKSKIFWANYPYTRKRMIKIKIFFGSCHSQGINKEIYLNIFNFQNIGSPENVPPSKIGPFEHALCRRHCKTKKWGKQFFLVTKDL